MADGVVYCVKCAQQNPGSSAECGNCGAPLIRPASKSQSGTKSLAAGSQAVPSPGAYAPGKGKSKMVAGILAILLGWLGIHHFYLGSPITGVIYLLISMFSCGTAVAVVIILSVVEGILLLVMPQQDFDRRYNFGSPGWFELVFMKR